MRRRSDKGHRCVALVLWLGLLSSPAHAQDNYEIQVYGSETMPKGTTMFELHSNFTGEGRKTIEDSVFPTNHATHETLEITRGFTTWFEVGFYTFTSVHSGIGWDWVGSHVRPRFMIPQSWRWPVGVSLSQEFGYQRREYSPDTWGWEIRPIIDKQMGQWYWSLNPTLERSFKGENKGLGFEFSPNVQVSYDFTDKINGALEYYGGMGPLRHWDPARQQEHQIFPAINLNLSPDWEFNAGVGIGLTRPTDHLIFKTIVGRRVKL